MASKPAKVVDTNVPVTANGRASHVSVRCQMACQTSILEITSGRARLVLDDGFDIFEEYLGSLSLSGQPGVGDQFLKWVHDRQFDQELCERVSLTPHAVRGYEEFPDDDVLAGFDPSDRKFAASARASQSHACVLNAVDSDWWDYEPLLAQHGIKVDQVCDDQVAIWRRTRELPRGTRR